MRIMMKKKGSGSAATYTSVDLTRTIVAPNLNTDNISNGDNFGEYITSRGNETLITAYYEDGITYNTGQIIMYDNTTWNIIRTFDNEVAGSIQFGNTTDLNDTYVVTGAGAYSTESRTNVGIVFIYDKATGNLIREVPNPDPTYNMFGRFLALHEDNTLYVSGPQGVFVFNCVTGEWINTLPNPHDNPEGDTYGDNFGDSLTLAGDRLFAAGTAHDLGTTRGRVYEYDRNTLQLIQTYDNPIQLDPLGYNGFGASLSVTNNYVVIGAPYEDSLTVTGAGACYIFDRNGNLLYDIKNLNPEVTTNSYFGMFVSISGKYVAISGYYDSLNSANVRSGYVKIYDATTGTLFNTIENENAYGTPDFDMFGRNIELLNDRLIIGAIGEDSAVETDQGCVYVYTLS